MGAKEDHAKMIGKFSDLLRNTEQENTAVPLDDFESTYRQLRGIKDFWDTGGKVSWKYIEGVVDAEWIGTARGDDVFRKYYKYRMEADRLEKML